MFAEESVLFGLLVLRALFVIAVRLLPWLLVAGLLLLFLPMVAVGTAGLYGWRLLQAHHPIRARWLGLVIGLCLVVYAGVGLYWRADPTWMYVLVHTMAMAALFSHLVAGLRGVPVDPLPGVPSDVYPNFAPPFYLVAVPAIPLGSVVAAGILLHWPTIWDTLRRRKLPLQVREASGLHVPWPIGWRVRHGVAQPADGWALGYGTTGKIIAIKHHEARHHVLLCGATGSGKTTILRHVLDGVAARCPVVLLDCKASQPLRDAVEALPGGVVWTIGGAVPWDALRGDPTAFANKLLAAEQYGPNAAIYRAAAERYVQWVGTLLEAEGRPREPTRIAQLLAPRALERALRALHEPTAAGPAAARDGLAPDEHARAGGNGAASGVDLAHIAACLGDLGQAETEGVAGFASRFGAHVEGVAGRSLGAGADALVLEDAIRAGRTVLFSLDAAAYQTLAAKLGAWVLLDLVRVAGLLQAERWGEQAQCYVIVDEFSALGREGRHVVPLLARAREAGMACIVATQGLADLTRVDRSLPQQMVQNTAVKLVLRQGSAEDAWAWARHLGGFEREELNWQFETGLLTGFGDNGRATSHWRRDFYVSPDELQVLGTGEAVLAVAPLAGQPRRLARVKVAVPRGDRRGRGRTGDTGPPRTMGQAA